MLFSTHKHCLQCEEQPVGAPGAWLQDLCHRRSTKRRTRRQPPLHKDPTVLMDAARLPAAPTPADRPSEVPVPSAGASRFELPREQHARPNDDQRMAVERHHDILSYDWAEHDELDHLLLGPQLDYPLQALATWRGSLAHNTTHGYL